MISALLPVNWEVMPSDLTLGAWDAGARPTSKLILENLCVEEGISAVSRGISWISLKVNVEKSSALVLLAEHTRMFFEGSRSNWWTT